MERLNIDIVSAAFSSSLGVSDLWIPNWPNLPEQETLVKRAPFAQFPLPGTADLQLAHLVREYDFLRGTDRVVQLAALTGLQAVRQTDWNAKKSVHIHVGSSRGATQTWEEAHQQFSHQKTVPLRTSPYTTLGNIATTLARVLHLQGAHLEHSITCSSGLQSVLNGIVWIQSGMAQQFLAGASEAPLTPFTHAAMEAVGLYGKHIISKPGLVDLAHNSLVLGEGAGMICLEPAKVGRKRLAQIVGVGWSQEMESSVTGISAQGDAFTAAMQAALAGVDEADYPEVVIMHAPGTRKGDIAEWNAVQRVFKRGLPACTSTKFFSGHTFGASGLLSLQWALHILHRQNFPVLPYATLWPQVSPSQVRSVLINAMGFGGNAISLRLVL